MLKNLILLNFVGLIYSILAQKTDKSGWILPNKEHKEIGYLLGIHQFNNTFIELGISQTKSKGGCVWGSYYYGKSLGIEYNPFQNKIGFVLNGWTSLASFIIVGANVNSYKDYIYYNLGIKPYIGFGPGNFSFTYGYNFQIIDHKIKGINKHCFSIRYNWVLK